MSLRRSAFARRLVLAGWSQDSLWGYDPVLECYWADLLPARAARDGPSVRIGPEHLISTMSGLARAVAFAAEVADRDVYLALTA